MKKIIIACIVGALLIFAWQFLSWTVLNLHKAVSHYTPNQDAILAALNTNLPEEGGYMVPGLPENASMADHEKLMEEANGKPWASIQYHKSMEANTGEMIKNMLRTFLVDIIMVWLFCWILSKINMPRFSTIFIASLFTGLIIFLSSPYTISTWYKWFDIMAHFTDAMVSWGLCGLWLGWWLTKK